MQRCQLRHGKKHREILIGQGKWFCAIDVKKLQMSQQKMFGDKSNESVATMVGLVQISYGGLAVY